jgi:hypothetical protein
MKEFIQSRYEICLRNVMDCVSKTNLGTSSRSIPLHKGEQKGVIYDDK